MTKQVLQQALEALETPPPGANTGSVTEWAEWYGKRKSAIEALREALAQQDFFKELAGQSLLSLWSNYCDKKMQVEELQAKLDALAQQGEQQPVALQWVAEMIMSDCGCSTNNQRLLERVIARIEQYERANTAAPASQEKGEAK